MREIRLPIEEGHGLEDYTGEVDTIARNALGLACYGVSIEGDCVRIHVDDDVSDDNPAAEAAVEGISQFYHEMKG